MLLTLPEITTPAFPPLRQIYYHHYSFPYVVLGNTFMWKCHLFSDATNLNCFTVALKATIAAGPQQTSQTVSSDVLFTAKLRGS